MKTPTNSHHLQLKQSSSDELLGDVVGFDQELIIEIILRLPVKSLLKFKCVSKSWLRLISSQHFIRSHFSTSESKAKADQYVNSQVLFSTLRPITAVKQFTLNPALYEASANVSDIEIPSQKPGQILWIVGIINGLVCVMGLEYMFIWNPVLRKSKSFPRPYFSQRISGYKYFGHGFGYDELNDDYKVVCVLEMNDETKVMVYSLLTDSWRRIEDFKHRLRMQDYGKYANGKIHWLASSSVDEMKIVSLDTANEKHGELQRPDYETGMSDWVLGVLRGQLSVLCDYDHKKADLWVMDKYGVDESWSKLVTIPYGNVHHATSSLPQVICILRNGVVVLSTGTDSLLVYHSEQKEFMNIGLGCSANSDFHLYVESLASPAGLGV